MNTLESLTYFKPEMILMLGSIVVLFSDFFLNNKKIISYVALAVLALTACFIEKPAQSMDIFNGFFMRDTLTFVYTWLVIGVLTVSVLISMAYSHFPKQYLAEYNSLILFTGTGLILMAAANNLLLVFLAIEFVSLVSYLLVGFVKKDAKSKEASLKYLLFGSVCSAIMLFGISLIYGYAGSLNLDIIRSQLTTPHVAPIIIVGILLMFTGLGFKVSMAPFHMWAPDVYEGAPTPVTAFLTVGPKALGFAVLIRLLSTAFANYFDIWSPILVTLAILTMTLGNVIAIGQTNIKRLIAYSSIAQAGYILMGLAVFTETGLEAIVVYLIAYAFTNLGAFTIVVAISENSGEDDLCSYAGLAKRSPFLAASLTIFLLSLAGIPPLAGFIGKFFVFAATIEAGFYMLAIAAAVNSVVAAFYYFRVVKAMYLMPEESESEIVFEAPLKVALGLTLAGTVLVGIFPQAILSVIDTIFPF